MEFIEIYIFCISREVLLIDRPSRFSAAGFHSTRKQKSFRSSWPYLKVEFPPARLVYTIACGSSCCSAGGWYLRIGHAQDAYGRKYGRSPFRKSGSVGCLIESASFDRKGIVILFDYLEQPTKMELLNYQDALIQYPLLRESAAGWKDRLESGYESMLCLQKFKFKSEMRIRLRVISPVNLWSVTPGIANSHGLVRQGHTAISTLEELTRECTTEPLSAFQDSHLDERLAVWLKNVLHHPKNFDYTKARACHLTI